MGPSVHGRDGELEPLPGGEDDHQELLNTEQDALLDTSEDATGDLDLISFATQYGLEHELPILQKAAFLIQNTTVERIPGITESEIIAIHQETKHKFRQPTRMYLIVLVTGLGAIGQGWAQTSMNGATLYFPNLFGIGSQSLRDTLAVGIVNSAIYLSNGLLGSWLVTPLNNTLGRRGACFAAALVSLIFNVMGSAVNSWQKLLLCRLALGVALGVISTTLNVFLAECAPATIRGGLAVSWQMFCAFGIFLGFLTNMIVDNNPEVYGPLRWRVMIMAAALPTLPLLLLIYLCPESPSWYIKNSMHYGKAFRSLRSIRNTELQGAREVLVLHQQDRQKRGIKLPFVKQLIDLFTVPRIRRATIAAYMTMVSQQLCGINVIAFYSSTIFTEAKFSPYVAEAASTIFGLLNFLGAFPAIWSMDSFGRRSLLLLTLPPMAVTMTVAGLSFSISDAKTRLGMVASMIYVFCLLYSPGMGPVPAAYSAEVFPLSHRELGTSSAVAMTNVFAAILSLTFPWLLSVLGTQGSFLLYAALNVLAWALVYLFVPETKR